MNGDFGGETISPADSGSWRDTVNTVLNTGLGVAGLFTNKTPAAAKTGTPGATNWTVVGIIAGGVLLVVVLIMSLRRG